MTGAAKLRLDKWLWFARFFKTRSMAARQVSAGHVRVNGNRIVKPAQAIAPQDVLTFAQGNRVRVVKVLDLGVRRGPADEARALYDDMSPEPEPKPIRIGPRPTKKDRRILDNLRNLGPDGGDN